MNEALFYNIWEQGEFYHPGIIELGNVVLSLLGYDINCVDIPMGINNTLFCNYFVANYKSWKIIMESIEKILIESNQNEKLRYDLFGECTGNYSRDTSLCMFPFLIERLVPTLMILNNINISSFVYDQNKIHDKYNYVYDFIHNTSVLKYMYNKYKDKEIYKCWDFYRSIGINNENIRGLG